MLTPEEIADCRADLLEYNKRIFKARKGVEMRLNWHQKAICDALEKVVIGETKRLIINVPPRSGKTEMAVINFIAWCMGNFPDCEFIHATYSARLAANNTWAARAAVESEMHQAIFGPTVFRSDSNAKDEWRTMQGGCVYATGAGGTITGYGAGKMRDTFGGAIIIDDPHKASEALSDTMRANVIDWFQTTMESRKNTPDTPIIVIMQRLHEEDLAGWLLKGGNGEHWEHVCIPATMEDGESFWPIQFPKEMLERLEKANPYVYAGQYDQRPSPKGGGLFKDAWWQYYSVEPRFEYRELFADTAQKTKERNDYSVFQCWGFEGGRAYLIDQVRGKWEAPELLTTARAFWNKHKNGANGRLRAFNIEDKASGTGLIQTLKKGDRERQIPAVPVKEIQRDKDKVTRAMDVAPTIQAGLVYLPEQAPFLSEFLAETAVFPNGAHDDQCDPMMDAVDSIRDKGTSAVGVLLPRRR